MSDYIVETEGLTKRFGARVAVDDVDLRIPHGSAFGYLGPNGAGKTTLIRMLLGLTRPTAGSMRLLGRPVPAERAEALARVGAIVEEPRFHPFLTGRENLEIVAAARDAHAFGRIDAVLERVGLAARADERVKKYSLGMRQRLGVARALLGDPELLILDEPTNGLDPAGILEFRGLMRRLVGEGRTVVLSSHLLDEVEKICDAVAIVDQGRVVWQGPIDAIRNGGRRTLHVAVDDEAAAVAVLDAHQVESTSDGLRVTVPADADPAVVAEINRRLVAAGIAVHRLELSQASLEERFLEITSRLEEAA
jgi:ABC-2 type transport system ATP-binding protein